LQAADLLAIKSHIEGTCCALALQIFPKRKKRKYQDEGTPCVAAEVRLFALNSHCSCWIVNALDERNLPQLLHLTFFEVMVKGVNGAALFVTSIPENL
jgi:hypothetical protein